MKTEVKRTKDPLSFEQVMNYLDSGDFGKDQMSAIKKMKYKARVDKKALVDRKVSYGIELLDNEGLKWILEARRKGFTYRKIARILHISRTEAQSLEREGINQIKEKIKYSVVKPAFGGISCHIK